MLTLLENIKRFNRHYNKHRGSAMLMVILTMSIIIVVGSSMLFVTLSSFNNSIANTNQTKAYNAALSVSSSIRANVNDLVSANIDLIKKDGQAKVMFTSDNELDSDPVDYLKLNGVKVSVYLTDASTETDTVNRVIVDVIGVKSNQQGRVSFYSDCVITDASSNIEEVFGNSLVMNSSLGSEVTDPKTIIRRIEGDVSINCFDVDSGLRVMSTRIFNPIILEGITGSIYANSDLIIGATDNMIRVQGNIYCDGNLTIRGLDLGCNLPALRKSYYNDKYIHYWSYVKDKLIDGLSIQLPETEKLTEITPDTATGSVGDSMYEKCSDGTFRIINCYDKLSHQTLQDQEISTFWTKVYFKDSNNKWSSNFTWTKVIINLDEDAESENNSQYLGAAMYSDNAGDGTPILQYPEGGNIFCSGDIIFDTVNYGNVYTYDAGIAELMADDSGASLSDKVKSYLGSSATSTLIASLVKKIEGDLVNPKYDYYSLAGQVDYGTSNGKIPVQTLIRGDVYCQGRMVIAPDITTSYTNYKTVTKFELTDLFSSKSNTYIDSKIINSKTSNLTSNKFFNLIKTLWTSGTGVSWGSGYNLGTVDTGVVLNRYNVSGTSITQNSSAISSFITAYRNAYNSQSGSLSGSYALIKDLFNKATKNQQSQIASVFAGDSKAMPNTQRTPSFSTDSNIYIYNDPIRKGMGSTVTELSERYASSDELRVVENTADISTEGRTYSIINDVKYTAGLSVRYMNLSFNKLYVNGDVDLLGSNVSGYENTANINVKSLCSVNNIINEYRLASIIDLLNYLGVTENKTKFINDYLGINSTTNNYKGTSTLTFSANDTATLTKTEKWWDWHGAWYGNHEHTVTHNLKIIVLRAHYEMTQTVNWSNAQTATYTKAYYKGLKLQKGYWTLSAESWSHTVSYSDGKFVPDLLYVISDDISYSECSNEYEGGNDFTGKLIDGNGNIISATLSDAETKLIEYAKNSNCTISATQFLDINYSMNYKNYFNSNVAGFNESSIATDPRDASPAAIVTTKTESKYDTLQVATNTITYDKSATRTITARYDFKLKSIADITGVSDLKDTVDITLKADDILSSEFMTKKSFLAIFSDKDSQYNALSGSTITVSSINTAKTETTPFKSLIFMPATAYDDTELYGMYLCNDAESNLKYAKVQPGCSVQNIFDEICSSTFANVIESNVNSSTNNEVTNILNDLKSQKKLTEYTKVEFITGNDMKNYTCSDGQTGLYKAQVSFTTDSVPADALDQKTIILGKNITLGSVYISMTNTKDTSSSLQLMKFSDKDNAKSLTADSTFAVDPLYSGRVVGTGDLRSEVQYTINKNTYFNFENYGDVTFGSSPDNSITNLLDSKRTNFILDTTGGDVYVFFNSGEFEITFSKCTFQVKGNNNAYIMLVGNTSINCCAYMLDLAYSPNNDTNDEKVGTHFISGKYQEYKLGFYDNNPLDVSSYFNILNVADAVKKLFSDPMSVFDSVILAVNSKAYGNPESAGDMFIIGMGKNNILFGRGGSVNALVYIPYGKYSNESSGLLSIVPIANSGNNEASIIANEIYIGGANRGQLIFTSYNLARIGTKNGSSATTVFGKILNMEITSKTTEWQFGGYTFD